MTATGRRAKPGRPLPYGLAALTVAAVVLLLGPAATWLTAPAAATVGWVGGTSVVALVLGDRGWGRIVDGVLGAVFAVVLMLVVALGLHYVGAEITRSSVLAALVAASGALAVLAAVTGPAPVRAGVVPKRTLIGAAMAAVVLVGAGSVAVAIQDSATPRFEEFVLVDPLANVPPSQRPVSPGAQVRVGFELRTHGYGVDTPVLARVDLGDASSGWSAAGPAGSGGTRVRVRRTIDAPTRPGAYRLVARVAFEGPRGEALERDVSTLVVVR